MKQCTHLELYCNRELTPQQRLAFEAHLNQCDECSDIAEKWHIVRLELNDMAREGVAALPKLTEIQRHRLLELAQNRVTARPQPFVLFRPLPVAAAALVIAAAVFLLQPNEPAEVIPDAVAVPITASLIATDTAQNEPISAAPGSPMNVPAQRRLLMSIGEDHVGMTAHSQFTLKAANSRQTEIALNRGTVACLVKPGLKNRTFVIDAGTLRVSVVGTQFLVDRDESNEISIRVIRGTVEVHHTNGSKIRVTKGQEIHFSADGKTTTATLDRKTQATVDELLSRSTEPRASDTETAPEKDLNSPAASDESPENDTPSGKPGKSARARSSSGSRTAAAQQIETWRSWILAGRLAQAEQALSGHVRRSPTDKSAWSLLAHCRRKQGKWSKAVEAYRKVIALGTASEANQARYKAGAILQDKLGAQNQAIELLEAYVQSKNTSRTLRAEALYRLARAYAAQNKNGTAIDLLNQVIEKHRGTEAAIRARQLLNRIGPAKRESS